MPGILRRESVRSIVVYLIGRRYEPASALKTDTKPQRVRLPIVRFGLLDSLPRRSLKLAALRGSACFEDCSPLSSRGPGSRILIPVTGVRIPLGVLKGLKFVLQSLFRFHDEHLRRSSSKKPAIQFEGFSFASFFKTSTPRSSVRCSDAYEMRK